MTWDAAKSHCLSFVDPVSDPDEDWRPKPSQTRLDPVLPHPYVITSRFDLSMIDLTGPEGATIRVRPLQKLDVTELLFDHAIPVISMDERGQTFLERELQLAAGPRPHVTPQTKLIVGERVAWNDVRWFVVEILADGDGCVG